MACGRMMTTDTYFAVEACMFLSKQKAGDSIACTALGQDGVQLSEMRQDAVAWFCMRLVGMRWTEMGANDVVLRAVHKVSLGYAYRRLDAHWAIMGGAILPISNRSVFVVVRACRCRGH